MKLPQILTVIMIGCFASSSVLSAVENSTARFNEVWSLDLANAIPPEMEKEAFRRTGNIGTIPCADGRAYISEGGNMQGGWSMATLVCHRNRDKNSAHWVIHLPKYPAELVNSRRLIGVDCSFAGNGWRCKKRVKMQSPIDPGIRQETQREDPDAFSYIKIL
jgi:hypothetical protein